jgi:hypothetical protein
VTQAILPVFIVAGIVDAGLSALRAPPRLDDATIRHVSDPEFRLA